MAPTATIVPWPGISRGTEATVPMPPGLVSVRVAPLSSSAESVLVRARSISRSYSSRNSLNCSSAALRITGTTSERDPVPAHAVDRETEVRGPGDPCRLTVVGPRKVRRHRRARGCGTSDRVSNEVREGHLAGVASSSRALLAAHQRLVEKIPLTVRNEVAVGMSRLRSMYSTSAAAGPLMGSACSPSATRTVASGRAAPVLAASTSALVTIPPDPNRGPTGGRCGSWPPRAGPAAMRRHRSHWMRRPASSLPATAPGAAVVAAVPLEQRRPVQRRPVLPASRQPPQEFLQSSVPARQREAAAAGTGCHRRCGGCSDRDCSRSRCDHRERGTDRDSLAFGGHDLRGGLSGCQQGTSTSTLSVVTSTSGSPSSTVSPTALSQRDTMPSDTDSPIAGRVSETGSATLESSHLRSSAVRLTVDHRRTCRCGCGDEGRHRRRRRARRQRRWHRRRVDHRSIERGVAADRRRAAGQHQSPVG